MNDPSLVSCRLCPRECGADRTAGTGYCGAPAEVVAGRASLHMWEEPCISGESGSGTVFFSGCPLKCVYCQNTRISHGAFGKEVTETELMKLDKAGIDIVVRITAFQTAVPV